jgi:drug/metabolite transporter (DMT)-like permease
MGAGPESASQIGVLQNSLAASRRPRFRAPARTQIKLARRPRSAAPTRPRGAIGSAAARLSALRRRPPPPPPAAMRLPVWALATGMLLAGSFNTICTKIQDQVVTSDGPFKHPAVQTACMFLGEALCGLVFLAREALRAPAGADAGAAGAADDLARRPKPAGARRRAALAFALPAACDAAATTLLNLGLYYTYASVFQMLRGTLVLFAALLTRVALGRRLRAHNWIGVALIASGAGLVGAASLLREPPGGGGGAAADPLLGDALVVAAQALNAAQFVLEERLIAAHRAPVLLAVGAEGAAGLLLSAAALPLLARIRGPGGQPLDAAAAAARAISGSWRLQWTTAGTVLSVALFNACGVMVTKRLSGASRAAIDAARTAVVWVASLALGWERFVFLQAVGFAVLLCGSSIYNGIMRSMLPAVGAPLPAEELLPEVEEPLLGGRVDGGGGAPRERERGARRPPRAAGALVTFAGDAPGARAASAAVAAPGVRAARARRYSLARSVSLLPGAMSPHGAGSITPNGPSNSALNELGSESGSSSGSGSEADVEGGAAAARR